MGNTSCMPAKGGESLVGFLRRKFKGKGNNADDLLKHAIKQERKSPRKHKVVAKTPSKDKSSDSGFDDEGSLDDVRTEKGGVAFVFDFEDHAAHRHTVPNPVSCKNVTSILVKSVDDDNNVIRREVEAADDHSSTTEDDNNTHDEVTSDDEEFWTLSKDFKMPERETSFRRFKLDIDHIPISQKHDLEAFQARREKQREMTREMMRSRWENSVLYTANQDVSFTYNTHLKDDNIDVDNVIEVDDVNNDEVFYINDEIDEDSTVDDIVINSCQSPCQTIEDIGDSTSECNIHNVDVTIQCDTNRSDHVVSIVAKPDKVRNTIHLRPKLPERLTEGCRTPTNRKLKRMSDNSAGQMKESNVDIKYTPRAVVVSKGDNVSTSRPETLKKHRRQRTVKDNTPLQQGPDKGIIWPKTIETLYGQQEKCYYVEQFTRTELYRQRCRRKEEGSVTWMNGLTQFQHWVIQHNNTPEMDAILHPVLKRTNHAQAKVNCWRGKTPIFD